MPKLIVQKGQSTSIGKDIYDFPDGTNATLMIMKHFPNGIDPECSVIYINSEKINNSQNIDERVFKGLFHNDTVLVINEVKGLDPITIAIIVAVAVTAATVILLSPKVPGNVGQPKDSPNNNLQGQTNIARPYQAYPLIFGSPRAYPDLTGEPIVEYVNNQKIVTQLMNIGVGLFDITEIRAGETPLINFTGASSTIYEPVNKIVTIPNVTTSFASNEVDGQELLGTNEGLSGTAYNLVENGVGNTDFIGLSFVIEALKDTQSDLLKLAFDASVVDYNLEVDYQRDVDGLGNFITSTGSGRVLSVILDGTLTFYTITISNFTGPKADPSSPIKYQDPFVATEKGGVTVGPINTSVESSELWLNFIFQRGLKGTVNINLKTQELDSLGGSPVGSPVFDNFSFTENTLDQLFFTHKKIFPLTGFFEFSVKRTNESKQDADNPDQVKFEAARSISKFTNLTFDNNTLIEVVVPATINATSLRENQINLSLTKKTLTYGNGSVSTIVSPSRRMADALLHMYVDFFGLDPSTLALDELYEIQNRLDAIDPALATFDFTFDDIDVSLDERMDTILQVARCFKWLDGDVYRFAREELRPFASTTITRRDISHEDDRDYSISYNPQLLEAFDSVKVEFVDKTTNKKSFIFRTFNKLSADPNNPSIISGVGKNPKTMQLAGCSESSNAINRAELEIRKLIYQRYILTETMLTSGMLLDRGDMVLYAEQYSSDLFDGEILAINGNIASTSEPIVFNSGDLFVHYMLEDGSKVGPFLISEVPGQPFKFNSADLSQAFVRDSVLGFSVQTGSRYIIGKTEDLDAARWTVIEKESRGNNVQLTMVNYDDKVFDFD